MISCKAVIFDMDGVIVDSEPRHKAAFLKVCDEIGYGKTHGIRFEDYVGRTDNDLWRDFLELHSPSQTMEELLRMKCTKVIEYIRSEKPLFNGLVDLVRCLSKTHSLGLASGSERGVVDAVLELENLHRYFRATVSGSEISKGKPDPEIFREAARLLGVAPKDCCVIEDSKPGVAAGLAAGMHVIAVTNTHPAGELTHAHEVVKSYSEIRALLAHSEAE